jgi:acyl-CoA reductase-like NAD-dependent aldehyde dehydrogenase
MMPSPTRWPRRKSSRANWIAVDPQLRQPGADAPLGGLTESGIGREGGKESLDAYMITKTVLQRIAPV